MLLRVGELARRAGVTVRALHHYDSIGLLRPSARSEVGYRLYNRDDVVRLHGIQALRQMGVPLADVAQLLDGDATTLQAILAGQIKKLEREIARGQALRDRLGVMQFVLARGGQPPIDDWLAALSMANTLEQYFSATDLQRIFERWKLLAAEWPPLVEALRHALQRRVPPDGLEIQPLLQQWLDLATRWMDGDLESLGRWGRMLREQPGLPLPAGIDLELLDYIDAGVRHRLALAAQVVGPEQRQRHLQARPQWRALVQRGHSLMAEGVPPDAAAARALARDWRALLDQTFGDDHAQRERVLAAYESEPLLQAGIPLTSALRTYIEQASGA